MAQLVSLNTESAGPESHGRSRSQRRCSVQWHHQVRGREWKARSSMRDANGRLVGRPLALGAPCCLYHAVLFHTCPAEPCDVIVAYIDLETDSLDVLSGNIIEIGALVGDSRAVCSTVVNPGSRCSQEAFAIHSIPQEELQQGPPFLRAFHLHVIDTCSISEIKQFAYVRMAQI